MDCIKVRNLISVYIDGETSSLEEEVLIKHIKSCSACKLEMGNSSMLSSSIEESYNDSFNIDFSKSIMDSIDESQPEKVGKIYQIAQHVYRPMAVAASVAMVASVMYLSASPDPIVAKKNVDTEKVELLVMEHINRAAVAERYMPEVTFASYDR